MSATLPPGLEADPETADLALITLSDVGRVLYELKGRALLRSTAAITARNHH
jgi:hypothetical protein